MAEVICNAGGKVVWSDWHRLAEKIDALAITLGTTDYIPLLTDDTLPFIEPTLPAVTMVQEFEVISNPAPVEPNVSDRYLLDTFGGLKIDYPLTPIPGTVGHAFYADYIQNNKLFFVHEADDCWCKTIFSVESNGGGFVTLEKVATPDFGCCQSMDVPGIGMALDYNQHFIPAGYAKQYGTTYQDALPISPPPMYCPKCGGDGVPPKSAPLPPAGGCVAVAGPDKVEYKYVELLDDTDPQNLVPYNPSRYELSSTARFLTGHLTWPVLKEHMDALVARLEFIVECSRNDGYKPKDASNPASAAGGPTDLAPTSWWDDDANVGNGYESHGGAVFEDGDSGGWIQRGSACGTQELRTWLASLRFEFENKGAVDLDPDENGTLVQTSDKISYISSCYVTSEFDKPWEVLTGTTPEECDVGKGPRVYCETLNQLSFLIEEIEERVWPLDTFNPQPGALNEDCLSCVGSSPDYVCFTVYPPFGDVEDVTLGTNGAGGWSGTDSLGDTWQVLPDGNGQYTVEGDNYAGRGTNTPVVSQAPFDLGDGELSPDGEWAFATAAGACPTPGDWCLTMDGQDNYGGTLSNEEANMEYIDDGPGYPKYWLYDWNNTNITYYLIIIEEDPFNPGDHDIIIDYETAATGVPLNTLSSGISGGPYENMTFYISDIPCGGGSSSGGGSGSGSGSSGWEWVAPDIDSYSPLVPKEDCVHCDNDCCLLHAAFLSSGCLEYFVEIEALLDSAFNGAVTDAGNKLTAYYPNGDCSQIRCGPLCSNSLNSSVEECIDQAAMVWSIEQYTETELGSGYDAATCDSVYYIKITAPSPPP